jgi:polysaccharide biosynthesis protein PslH
MRRVALIANAAPWPPTNGATVRQFNVLKQLKKRGYSVAVFGLCEARHIEHARKNLSTWADEIYIQPKESRVRFALGVLRSLLFNRSMSESIHSTNYLKKTVASYFEQFPSAQAFVHSSNVAVLVPVEHRGSSLFDLTDVDSSKFEQYADTASFPMRWVYRREGRLLRRLEHSMINYFASTVVIADRELAELEPSTRNLFASKLYVISNGVEAAAFSPLAPGSIIQVPEEEKQFFDSPNNSILFPGVMDYPPNIEAAIHFARDIFPKLRERYPDLKFVVMGARPTKEVLDLKRIEGVLVTGFVDSAIPYFQNSRMIVIPLRLSRGVQNKALEAMACARPLVAYEAVAQGLNKEARALMKVAKDRHDFLKSVCEVLETNYTAQDAVDARNYVEQFHNWEKLTDSAIALLEKSQVT